MNEQYANKLYKRLIFLGYRPFEIKRMVEETIGTYNFEGANSQQRIAAIKAMQRYEKLGSQFLELYSK